MAGSDTMTPLRRMLAPRRHAADHAPNAVEQAVRTVFPRVADDLLDLTAAVQVVSSRRSERDDVIQALGNNDLIFLMTRNASPPGICVLDAGLVSALVEVQTTGSVSTATPPERLVTRTDSIIVSGVVDQWIAAIGEAAQEGGFTPALSIFRFLRSPAIMDKRATALTLDPGMFQTLRIAMSLGDGAKDGALTFYVPDGGDAGQSSTSPDRAEALRAQLMDVPATMNAVLARLPIKLSRVLSLNVGDVISVPGQALGDIMLEGKPGQNIARGKLGQLQGARAVRLHSDGSGPAPRPTLADLGAAMPKLPRLAGMDGVRNSGADPTALPETAPPELASPMPELPDIGDFSDLPELPAIAD